MYTKFTNDEAEPCEEDQSINILLRSGITIGADKGNQPEEDGWVCKALEKEFDFDLNHTKETFVEARKSFVEASILGRQDKAQEPSATQEVDPSILTTFL